MAITQAITAFPPAPNAGSDTPEEFSNKADTFVAHQSDNYTPEVNQWATEANLLATDVNTDATNAQLDAWNAEAEKLTADSYATQLEDVFVNVYTSNGDGTFTATPTTEYSALHYSIKAQNLTTYDSLTDVDTIGVVDGDVMMWDAIALKWVRQVLDWNGIVLTGQDLIDVGIIGTSAEATLYPDGSIVGSSSNGSFTKYSNGNIEMYHSRNASFSGNTYAIANWIFPIPFLNTDYVPIGAPDNLISPEAKACFVYAVKYLATASETNIVVERADGTSSTGNVDISMTVKGRWR